MQVDKTTIKNIYEIMICDYEHGRLEFLRTYILIFDDEDANVESELKKLDIITSGEELEIYLESKEYTFKYLINYDHISTEEFLGKQKN